MGSIVLVAEPATRILGTAQYAMGLLRTSFMFPESHFHQLTTSASELLVLLTSCVSDPTQISATQALLFAREAHNIVQNFRLSGDVRHVLEQFLMRLDYDESLPMDAQMLPAFQFALGRTDTVLSASSDTDIVTCSLVLTHLVGPHAVKCLFVIEPPL